MCGQVDLATVANVWRVDFGTEANTSGLGCQSRQVLDRPSVPCLDESTWPPELTCLDGLIWPPKPIGLHGSTLLQVLICLNALTCQSEHPDESTLPPISQDRSIWLPEQTSIDGLIRPPELQV